MSLRTSDSCGKPPYSIAGQPLIDPASSHAAFVLATICAVCGVAGNLVSVGVLLGNKSIRKHPTTPFLASLAYSDLIFSGFNMPLMAARFYHREWVYGYGTCVMFPFFFYANIDISAFSMAFIAVNRFVGIYFPHRMPDIFTIKKSWLMVIFIWLFSFALMLLPLTELWGQMGYEPLTFSCTILPKNGHDPLTFLVVVGVILPCATMMASYGAIFWRVRRTGANTRRMVANETEQLGGRRSVKYQTEKRERQLTRTLSMVCGGFLICFLPSALMMLFDPMPPCWKNPEWHVATYAIFWLSAVINPFIYTFSNRHYRLNLVYYAKKAFFCAGAEDAPTSTWFEEEAEEEDTDMTDLRRSERRKIRFRDERRENDEP